MKDAMESMKDAGDFYEVERRAEHAEIQVAVGDRGTVLEVERDKAQHRRQRGQAQRDGGEGHGAGVAMV